MKPHIVLSVYGVRSGISKKRESEQGSSAENENLQAGCIAAVNKLLCDTPSVDFSRDRTALSGKFPEDELKGGRELELRNQFKAEELRDDLFAGVFHEVFIGQRCELQGFRIYVITHSKRNCVGANNSHSTGTCTAAWCVIEL